MWQLVRDSLVPKAAPAVSLSLSLLILGGCGSAPETWTGSVPETRQDNVVDVLHGVEIVDPYRWLEDQESVETRRWIDAQNGYMLAHLGKRPERALLAKRLGELMRIDQVAAPLQRGERFFVWKKNAEDDLWILHLRQGLEGEDEVLIDPHTLSPDHTAGVVIRDMTQDGQLLAYSVRVGGADETDVRVMDVNRRLDLPDRLPLALYGSTAWTPDKKGFYYARRSRETGPRIFHHELGTDPDTDPLIFGQGYTSGTWISAMLSHSGRYLLFQVGHGWSRTDLFLRDLESDAPASPLVRDLDATFFPAFAGDRLFVHTNWQAPTGRILEIDLTRASPDGWREVVPARGDAIQSFSLAAGQLYVRTLHNVLTRIERFDLKGDSLGEITLPGPGSAGAARGWWNGDSVFYTFESHTSPARVLRFDPATATSEVWSRSSVPFSGEGYTTEQVWYPSKDGTRIPMFVVHREDVARDGARPTLLYGYGGFNVSLTPRFSPLAALWIEHGGVYVVANLRGGGEFGEQWHRAGMLENKQNVFDDFIAAAEHLIASGYTQPERLAIQGGSNGGLLVGAAMTQRPELFRAVVCSFPDLDMVRYYQFENNNAPALLEYGDASDPEQFKFLYAYSPYQAVRDGTAYPAALLITGDQDTRVPPLQARKMAARLQAATSSGLPVLLRYDTQAGHAGGRPLSKVIDDASLDAVFLFSQLGVEVD